MTIQQVNVGIIAASIANNPAGATSKGRVVFTLVSADITPGPFGGVTIPSQLEVILSASGLGSAALYTTSSTQYRVDIYDVNGRKSGEWLATVPAFDCNLHDILGALPLPTVDAAQAAILAAQGYVAQATTQANNASGYSTSAMAYRDTTLTYKNAAQTSASNAATSEGNAAGSATAASTSAGTASTQATLAASWATSLTVVSGGLFGSRYYANAASTSAAAAAQSAIDANTYAGQASASATQASGYNASSLGYSNLAQQWATSMSVVTGGFYGALKYAQDASAAVALATAQANLAVNASGTAQGAATSAQQAQALAIQFSQICSQYAALGAGYLQQLFTQLASAATITAAVTSTGASAGQAQAQASLASSAALSALSVAAQDLSGVTAAALHRSPNAVSALFVYDTSKDSDGGAWVERMGDKSWMQEALNGTWLTNGSNAGIPSELVARAVGATVGAEQNPSATFAAGWTPGSNMTITGGKLVATANTTAAVTTVAGVVGTLYAVSITVDSITAPGGGGISVQIGGATALQISAPGTYTDVVVATSVGPLQVTQRGTGSGPFVVSAVSAKPITAINTKSGDYYQLASDGKFYKLWRNVLRNADDLTNASWAKADTTVTADQAAGVDGLMTMDLLTEGSAGTAGVTSAGYAAGGVLVAGSVNLKRGNHDWVRVRIVDNTTNAVNAWFNLNTGAAGAVTVGGAATNASSAIVNLGGGIYRCIVSGNVPGTGISINHMSASADANTARAAGGTRYADKHYMQVGVTAATIGAHEAKDNDTSQTEVFRGNTAKFPKQVAIVAENDSVSVGSITLYDLTQPGRPMWKRFVNSVAGNALRNFKPTSLAMLNGELVAGANVASGDLHRINFLKDSAASASDFGVNVYKGNLAQANAALGHTLTSPGVYIANRFVNAVAMTVLPSAPVDPVTGLQVPTIALAVGTGNAGQIGTVLMNDGTGVNYSNTGQDGSYVAFTPRGDVTWGMSNTSSFFVMPLASSTVASVSAVARSYNTAQPPAVLGGFKRPQPSGKVIAAAQTTGMLLLRENPSTPAAGLMAYVGGTYSTGWMVGDIRRSLAADTVAGAVSGAELSPNVTCDTTTSWQNTTGTPTLSSVSGKLRATTIAAGNYRASLPITCAIGILYEVTMDVPTATAGGSVSVASNSGLNTAIATAGASSNGTYKVAFVATATTMFVGYGGGSAAGAGEFFELDNVSVKLVVPDRSVKAKNSSINGTLAMTAVASAAQLVAYSGFSNDPAQTAELVSNGDFAASLAGWTATNGAVWSSGVASLPTVSSSRIEQIIPTVAGRSYSVTATIGGTGSFCGVWAAAGQSSVLNDVSGISTAANRSGTVTFTFLASNTTSYLSFAANGAGAGTVDNVSVKPLSAIGSAANVIQEPWSADLDYGTAQWMAEAWFNVPATGFGPSNFIVQSADLTNGAWAKRGTCTVTAGLADPFGGTAGFTVAGLDNSASTNDTFQIQSTAIAAGVPYTPSLWINRGGASTGLVDILNPQSGNFGQMRVDLATLGAGWVRVYPGHPAVTVLFPFVGYTTGGAGFHIKGGAATAVSVGIYGPQVSRGSVLQNYWPTTGTAYNGIAPIIDRSGPSGAYWRMGMDGNGFLAAEAFDGTTTRRVTSTVAVNDGNAHHGRFAYVPAGASSTYTLQLDGVQNAQTTAAALLTLSNTNALLTHGNSFALNAAFPGSIALVRTGATVPFAEQIAFMYAQERQMFQPGAQVALPDTGAVLDMSYDDVTDRLKGATAANEFSFTGLVRVESSPAAAGTISKVAMRSGIKLVARITTNPGVDISTPSLNLREELLKRADAAARVDRSIQVLDVDSITSQTDFVLPAGHELVEACSAGALKREGASKDFTRVYDGFKETVRFGTQQGTNWVQLKYRRAA